MIRGYSNKCRTILPGVTRASVLEIVELYHDELLEVMKISTGNADIERVKAAERDVLVKDMKDATEAFVTGTAAEIVPVASVCTGENDPEQSSMIFKYGETMPGGPVTAKILELLRAIMSEEKVGKVKGWLPDPFDSAESFRSLE